jgi:hypothetical protein
MLSLPPCPLLLFRREVSQAQEAAEHAFQYVERRHPDWIPERNLSDPVRVRGMRLSAMASSGKRLIDQARCVLIRLSRSIDENRDQIAEAKTVKPFSIDLVQWFIGLASVEAAR